MTYILPVFNLQANVWHGQGSLGCPTGYRDLVVQCNLALGRRGGFNESNPGQMWALFPPLTDVRPPGFTVGPPGIDIVEIPANSGRIYEVIALDDAGAGFNNEHRVAMLRPSCTWPVPVPGGGPVPAPPTGIISLSSFMLNPGIGFAGVQFNVAAPTRGLLILVVVFYEPTNTGIVTTATILAGTTGVPIIPMTGGVFAAEAGVPGVQAALQAFTFPVSAGDWRISLVPVPSNAQAIQVKVFLLQESPGTVFASISGNSAAPPPSLTLAAANSLIPAVYLSTFVLLNPVGAPGWNGPFGLVDADLSGVILGVTCVLTAGVFVSGVLSMPTGSLAVVVPALWIGNLSGYQ